MMVFTRILTGMLQEQYQCACIQAPNSQTLRITSTGSISRAASSLRRLSSGQSFRYSSYPYLIFARAHSFISPPQQLEVLR